MDKHYFTFGIGYPETVQVIQAADPEEARKRMFASYGNKFAFQYSQEEWQQSLSEGFFKNARYLETIIVGGVSVDSHKQR